MTRTRNGAAAAETAIALPIVVLVMVSAIEVSDGIHQQHQTRVVLHECAKFAARRETTSEQLRSRTQAMLSQFGNDQFDIQIDVVARTANVDSVESPSVTSFTISSDGTATAGLDEVPRGTLLGMTLTVPRTSLLDVPRLLGPTSECRCVFAKEN